MYSPRLFLLTKYVFCSLSPGIIWNVPRHIPQAIYGMLADYFPRQKIYKFLLSQSGKGLNSSRFVNYYYYSPDVSQKKKSLGRLWISPFPAHVGGRPFQVLKDELWTYFSRGPASKNPALISQTREILRLWLFLTSSFPSGFCRRLGLNPRPSLKRKLIIPCSMSLTGTTT